MGVVEFPKAEIGYWTCACGCMSHQVRSDGEVECAHCGELAHGPGYFLRLPQGIIRDPAPGEAEPFTYKTMGDEFGLKRFAGRVLRGEFLAVIGLRKDGRVGTFTDPSEFETAEQRQWLRRRLREAYRMLCR